MSNIKEPEENRWAYPVISVQVGLYFGGIILLLLIVGIWISFGYPSATESIEDFWSLNKGFSPALLLFGVWSLYFMRRLLQKVRLDEEGVSSYLFGKEVCRFSWEEVGEIGFATFPKIAGVAPLMYFTNKTYASYWTDRHRKVPRYPVIGLSFVTVRKRPKTTRRLIALEYNEKNKAELDQYVTEWRKLRYYLDEKYSDKT